METTYYNSSGVEVGRSHKMTNQFQNFDGTTVTSQDVHYQAADGTFLGNEFSNNDSSGFRIEKLVSVTEEPAWLDFDDDGTDGESSITAIEMIFEKGSDSWTFQQNGVAQTNTRTFEHYFNKDTREHLGGKEVQNGVTMKFGPNWTELGSQKDASALSDLPALTSSDGLAYTFYGTAKYDTQTFTRPDGRAEIEKIYYDSDGNTLGRSIQDTYEVMDDGFLRIETNIDYRGPVDEFLGRSFSDDKGNSGQDIEYRTTLTKEPTYVDFDGNGTPGETISGSGRAVRVQRIRKL